mgnify:CR=1 FL=1
MSINKVIIWGHKLHSHTHSYIHDSFYKAFKFLGYNTYWFDENGNNNNGNKEIRCLTMPDYFQDHASQNEQLAKAGLDVVGLANIINEMLPLSKLNNDMAVK